MARVKIELPPESIASVTLPVRITDLNYGNHVGNHAMVAIIHEARVQFLNLHGFTEMNAGGTSLIMNELLVEFKNESFYKDVLKIKIFCGEVSRVSFELFYLITVQRNDKEITIAHAKTGMVCYNYSDKRIEMLPDELKAILV